MTDKSWDIDTALAMVAGQDVATIYNASVDDADKQIIRDALENIFQGSSVIFWSKGGTLQTAWTTALDVMRDEFFATSRRDALTIFLQRAVFEHREMWMKKMMSNDNRFQTISVLGLNGDKTQELLKHAQFQKQQGYDAIKKLFEKYDTGFKPVASHIKSQTKELNIEHSRENENVRTRTK